MGISFMNLKNDLPVPGPPYYDIRILSPRQPVIRGPETKKIAPLKEIPEEFDPFLKNSLNVVSIEVSVHQPPELLLRLCFDTVPLQMKVDRDIHAHASSVA